MDNSLEHVSLPHVSHIDASRPFVWLAKGWQDLKYNPMASMAYGILFAAAGLVVLMFAGDNASLFAAALSGFMLLGPLLAVGLYELSRLRSNGMHGTFDESLGALSRNSSALVRFGGILAIFMVVWERLSAAILGSFGGHAPRITDMTYQGFLVSDQPNLLLSYLVVGGVLALVVFSISAISVPMMMDRQVSASQAMSTSLRAVITNPIPMLIWAGLIVAMIMVGYATYLLGLIVTLPLVGHASWHAYKDLTS